MKIGLLCNYQYQKSKSGVDSISSNSTLEDILVIFCSRIYNTIGGIPNINVNDAHAANNKIV